MSGVSVADDASLRIEFRDGERLEVSGQPDDLTTHDVWWREQSIAPGCKAIPVQLGAAVPVVCLKMPE